MAPPVHIERFESPAPSPRPDPGTSEQERPVDDGLSAPVLNLSLALVEERKGLWAYRQGLGLIAGGITGVGSLVLSAKLGWIDGSSDEGSFALAFLPGSLIMVAVLFIAPRRRGSTLVELSAETVRVGQTQFANRELSVRATEDSALLVTGADGKTHSLPRWVMARAPITVRGNATWSSSDLERAELEVVNGALRLVETRTSEVDSDSPTQRHRVVIPWPSAR